MENITKSTHGLKALIAAFAGLAIAIALMPAVAHAESYTAGSVKGTANSVQVQAAKNTKAAKAKTAKKVVKNQAFTCDTATINKKATKVKKGASAVTVKGGKGYISFTAPKTKKYSFTFSNVKSTGNSSSAFLEVQKVDSNPAYSFMTQVSTKGGKSNTLWLSANGYQSNWGDIVNRPIPTRTATTKLHRGEKIFFYFSATSSKSTFNLKIK